MQSCLLSLAYLLVMVTMVSISHGIPWSFLDLRKAQVDIPHTAKRYIRATNKSRNPFNVVWTQITRNPTESGILQVNVGSRVELECGVVGNPSPQLYWITGNDSERQLEDLTMLARSANNPEYLRNWKHISQVSSKLVIDCVRPQDEGFIYCVSVSRDTVASSIPTKLEVDTSRTTNCSLESEPTITLYSPWIFSILNEVVTLPCRFTGEPIPYLYWLDNSNNTITTVTHDRYTVLSNGDLQITNLEWSDMGVYTCTVQTSFIEKSVTTFLYPVATEELNEVPTGEEQ